MINPIIVINNKQIVNNCKEGFSVCNIPQTLMNTISKTVPNTVSNLALTVMAIPPSVKQWPCDEASDTDIRALVIDIMIPDSQRLTEEEQFEENFALLY